MPLVFLKVSYLGFHLPWFTLILHKPLCRCVRLLSDWLWSGSLVYLLSHLFPTASQWSGGLGQAGLKLLFFFSIPQILFSYKTLSYFLLGAIKTILRLCYPSPHGLGCRSSGALGAGWCSHGCTVCGPLHDRRVLKLRRWKVWYLWKCKAEHPCLNQQLQLLSTAFLATPCWWWKWFRECFAIQRSPLKGESRALCHLPALCTLILE